MKEQTTKFTKYINYLNLLINILKVEEKEFQAKIDLYRAIVNILEKRSTNQRIFLSDYESLSRYSCPDHSTRIMFALSDINQLSKNYNELLSDCSTMTCGDCWKKYIDELTSSINNSDLRIKNFIASQEDN